MKSRIEEIPVNGFEIDPDLWGPPDVCAAIKRWLVTEYDPVTMPVLAAADVKGKEGVYLMGWDNEGTSFPPLIVYLFGPDYAEAQLAVVKMRKVISPAEGSFGIGL